MGNTTGGTISTKRRQPPRGGDQKQGDRRGDVAAFDAGYFTVPRETTLTELADPLNKSPQAVLEQLRRGTGDLVKSTLITHNEAEDE